jgi:putative transposase
VIYQLRKRTKLEDIVYSLNLYFSGLSLRNTAKAISKFIKRSHTAIRDWILRYKPERLFYNKTKIFEYIIDETQIKVGSEFIWLWVAIESETKNIVATSISKERNMFVAERFLYNITKDYGKHPVSTDGGTWYPQACKFLKLQHHLHSAYEKSIIERMIQYIKDRTENFDDYFPCRMKNCKLKHVTNWLKLFAHFYNMEAISLTLQSLEKTSKQVYYGLYVIVYI